jgi:hypothetical protein
LVDREVDGQEDQKTDGHRKCDSDLRNLVDDGHFMLKGSDGVVRETVEDESQSHQSHDYPTVGAFSVLLLAGGLLDFCRFYGVLNNPWNLGFNFDHLSLRQFYNFNLSLMKGFLYFFLIN